MNDLKVRPPYCTPGAQGVTDCGFTLGATGFFFTFVILQTYMLANLFVAAIMENMASGLLRAREALTPDHLRRFQARFPTARGQGLRVSGSGSGGGSMAAWARRLCPQNMRCLRALTVWLHASAAACLHKPTRPRACGSPCTGCARSARRQLPTCASLNLHLKLTLHAGGVVQV